MFKLVAMNKKDVNIVIVSGYSGSGKSHALKYLENCSYYCIDNLPLELVKPYLELYLNNDFQYTGSSNIAIGIDVRSTFNFTNSSEIITNLKKQGYNVKLLFMTADKNILIKRFKETRNFHPINLTLDLAIDKEIAILNPLRTVANLIFDTSNTNVHELRQHIYNLFLDEEASDKLVLRVVSFGFSKGTPMDVDTLFDVRFLPNPYFVTELKNLTGKDSQIIEYIESKDVFKDFWQKFITLLEFLIPKYKKEGKSYLTIGVGCTGGRHRSVMISEKIAKHFKSYSVKLEHRDIYK